MHRYINYKFTCLRSEVESAYPVLPYSRYHLHGDGGSHGRTDGTVRVCATDLNLDIRARIRIPVHVDVTFVLLLFAFAYAIEIGRRNTNENGTGCRLRRRRRHVHRLRPHLPPTHTFQSSSFYSTSAPPLQWPADPRPRVLFFFTVCAYYHTDIRDNC